MLRLDVQEVENGYIVSKNYRDPGGFVTTAWVCNTTEELGALMQSLAEEEVRKDEQPKLHNSGTD